MIKESQWASEDIHDANEGRCIPFDSYGTIDFIIPKTWTWNIESTISLLHDDAISNKFEVFIHICDIL